MGKKQHREEQKSKAEREINKRQIDQERSREIEKQGVCEGKRDKDIDQERSKVREGGWGAKRLG